jgi:hypothetical protein
LLFCGFGVFFDVSQGFTISDTGVWKMVKGAVARRVKMGN